MTHNHANYQARLDFVQRLLHKQFNLEADAKIVPIQYDPECPFKYNNFVYNITLPLPITSDHSTENEARQPGCDPIPDGTKQFILRLTNPDAEGMSPETRVENEVAMINLAAAALRGFQPSVVPSVYAWGSAATESSQGWIIQELMPGESVDESFASMDLQQKKLILSQMAKLLKALQDYQLPESITGLGGVTFDENGRVVSAAMTSVGAGPWPSYESSFKGRLGVALQRAEANPYIQGWHANGIRDRLDAFVERGVPSQFETLKTAQDKSIIHADFTTNNLLFDASTHRITALIDYDFACIMHPSYEFLRSFDGAGGQFRGWSGDEAGEQAALRKAKLHGFPSPLPQSIEDGVNWEIAKAWEDELEKQDVKRPATIEGIDKVADVDSILRTILPWRVSNSDILRMQSEKVIMECKEDNEKQLVQLLERLGF
ncbi:phosphotransferase enzyme family-domain-containing protein [Whalleya microplaca]|nr:phosphotransferase enzyme family-domain-containing protein [Whalleya microplaca]